MDNLPGTIWSEFTLFLPDSLASSYRTLLEQRGLYDSALRGERSGRGPIGGVTADATYDHFTQRFAVSATRLEYIACDPKETFHTAAHDLHISFGTGSIAVLDVPCGAGASIFGFLCALAELRKYGTLPRLPLNISIVAGDCSTVALELYEDLVELISPELSKQGILITYQTHEWRAEEPITSAVIVDEWFAMSPTASEYYVFICNFSGEAKLHFHDFERSFQHIAERLHSKKGTMLWVEPGLMKSAHGFFSKLFTLFRKITWFRDTEKAIPQDKYEWFCPIKREKVPASVMLLRYRRE
jgi:hypothetical protein